MSDNQQKINTALLIVLKALVLVIIVCCVFFIVNEEACTNLLTGNMTINPAIKEIGKTPVPAENNDERYAPEYEEPAAAPQPVTPATPPEKAAEPAIIDADVLQQQIAAQDAFDYDVIKRYVELEKEYLKTRPNDKNTAAAVTEQVMKEKQITAQDWEEILMKANEKGWFNQLRNQP